MQPQKQPKLSMHVERWSDVQLQTFFMLPKIKKTFQFNFSVIHEAQTSGPRPS